MKFEAIKKAAVSLSANGFGSDYLRSIEGSFRTITGVSGTDKKGPFSRRNEIAGISSNGAAKCLSEKEDTRTKYFLQSIIEAIKNKLKSKSRVNVLYAGCGPFAPFLSLVAPLFSPDELRFTLIEINEHSFKAANKIIDEFELDAYVYEFLLADATKHKVSRNYDILISETIAPGLTAEPFVAIMMNLKRQLPTGAIVIPEDVEISLQYLVGDVSKLPYNQLVFSSNQLCKDLKAWHKIIEKPRPGTYENINIITEVKIDSNRRLKAGDSSMCRIVEKVLGPSQWAAERLELEYRSTPIPGINFAFI